MGRLYDDHEPEAVVYSPIPGIEHGRTNVDTRLEFYTLCYGRFPNNIAVDFGISYPREGYYIRNNRTNIVEYVSTQYPDAMFALHRLEITVRDAPWEDLAKGVLSSGDVAPNGDVLH